MYFKLSLRNFKRSMKDYFIYFFTLTFAVCLFYIFNSFSAQSEVMKLSETLKNSFKLTDMAMTAFSVIVAFTLGFLIIYANNFLIKKRKRELGIYMTLGMPRRKISNIFIVETFFIGLVSLLSGILLGIFLSQGITIVTANLLNAEIETVKIVISSSAILKTILCFTIIFLCVVIFNNRSLSKHPLIELINDERKNEKFKIKNIYISFILFIISIIGIGYTYYSFINNASDLKNLGIFIITGVVSVFIFFLSICGFLLQLTQMSKKIYFSNLNMFLLRQLNSKINTNYISLALICILLTLTLSFISIGFGAKSAQEGSIEFNSPYDASCQLKYNDKNKEKKIEDYFSEFNVNIEDFSDEYVKYDKYDSGIAFKSIINPDNPYDEKIKTNLQMLIDFNVTVIKISDYNKLINLKGENQVSSIKENEVILLTDQSIFEKELNEYIKNNKSIEINNKSYNISNPKVLVKNLVTNYAPTDFITLIVPDECGDSLVPISEIVSLEYKEDSDELNEKFEGLVDPITEEYGFQIFQSVTKSFVGSYARSLSTLGVYISSYLGLIFLISSATLLALQQLSESEDNKNRFRMLKKIGVDSKMIESCLFKQILIYFMAPLILAVVNSIVIIIFAEKTILSILGVSNMLTNMFITVGITIIIYGAYFLATYNAARMNIKKL